MLLGSSASLVAAGLAPASLAEEPAGPLLDIHSRIRSDAEQAPLAMRFTGTTAAECQAWQKAFEAKLRSLLGDFAPPKDWKTVVEKRVEKDGYVQEELLLSAEGHPTLPVAVLTPTGSGPPRRPGLLMLHGHGPRGYYAIAEGENSGVKLVRQGYVVAAPCFTPFGRRLDGPDSYGKQDACGISFIRMQLLGKLLIAENLRDAALGVRAAGPSGWRRSRAARLCRPVVWRPDDDAHRRPGAANSRGGRFRRSTCCKRILGRYSCGAQVIPGLLQFGDVPEIGSLIAPRPAVWEWGSSDGLIDPDRAAGGIARMQRAYDALGAGERLVIDRFDGGHEWSWRKALPLLERVVGT